MARVVMVVRPSRGGAWGHVVRLGQALAEHGHDVAVAGPHGAWMERVELEILDIDMGRSVSPRADAKAARALARAWRDWQPDLVHAHGSKGGVLARLARMSDPRTPVVLSPHNYAFTNYFSSATERGAYRAIETALSPLASRTLCVCEAEAAVARRVGLPSRVRVVHNGIDPEPPAGVPVPRPAGSPLLVAVTEFHPAKGVPTLLEAMPRILDRLPSARLAVAGDGPMRDAVEAQITDSRLDDAVDLLGQIDGVPSLLAEADALVAPGWSESFPYAILEAMRAGLPVISTDVGGTSEAVVDGVTGALVPPNDADALAEATFKTLIAPAEARTMGEEGQRRQRRLFTFEGMVAGTLAVYAELGIS